MRRSWIAVIILALITPGIVPGAAQQDPPAPPGAPPWIEGMAGPGVGVLQVAWGEPSGTFGEFRVYRGVGASEFSLHLITNASTFYIVDSGLPARTTYHYYVTAVNAAGEGSPSTIISLTTIGAPEAPVGLEVTKPAERTIAVQWYAGDDGGSPILHYEIRMQRGDGAVWGPYQVTPVEGLNTFLHEGLRNGLTHTYFVRAVTDVGAGKESSATATPYGPPWWPNAPRAVSDREDGVRFSWRAPGLPSGPFESYEVWARDAGSSGAYTFLDSVEPAEGTMAFVEKGLASGQAREYRVRAMNSQGAGDFSFPVTTTAASVPAPPEGLRSRTMRDTDRVELSWLTPADDGGARVIRYHLELADDIHGVWERYEAYFTGLSLSVSQEPGTERAYRVVAYNAVGESAPSDPITVTHVPARTFVAVGDPLDPPMKSCTSSDVGVLCVPGSEVPVRAVALGASHSCVLLADGRADCWGLDAHGQSGDWSLVEDRIAVAVAAGDSHTCILGISTGELGESSAECWGDDAWGKASPSSGAVRAIEAGGSHTCFLEPMGTAHCIGSDFHGQSTIPAGAAIEALALGDKHTCILRETGDVDCVGYATNGRTAGHARGDAIRVSAGAAHGCVVTMTRTVSCWGRIDAPPSAIQGRATDIRSAADHACVQLDDGTISCFGDLRRGQAPPANAGPAIAFDTGPTHTCLVREGGTLDCYGTPRPHDRHGQGGAYP